MKRILSLALFLLILGLVASPDAQAATNKYGAGVLPDDDGDGIPNGCDPDYLPPLDGTGFQYGNPDADCIFVGNLPLFLMNGTCWIHVYSWKSSFGPGDGTGNEIPPLDGTGYGPGVSICQ